MVNFPLGIGESIHFKPLSRLFSDLLTEHLRMSTFIGDGKWEGGDDSYQYQAVLLVPLENFGDSCCMLCSIVSCWRLEILD